jgi:type II secretory pathway pseudopilin PulG
MHRLATQHRTLLRRGFTLTELLISVGLALLVLYGINRVFTATTTTIGTGQALSDANRSLLAAHTQFVNDIEGYGGVAGTGMLDTANQPLIVIRNQEINMWMDAADYANDTTPGDPFDEVTAGTVTPTDRIHRIDTLSFFAGGTFQRRTGQKVGAFEVLVNTLDVTAKAAFIHYGHARLPKFPEDKQLVQYDGSNPPPAVAPVTGTDANYIGPGELNRDDNPKNYFASQWILARNAIPIIKRNPYTNDLYDGEGRSMIFFRRNWVTGAPTGNDDGSPFAFNSQAALNDSSDDDLTATVGDEPTGDAPATTPGNLIQRGLHDIASFDDTTDGVGVGGALPTGYYASVKAFQTLNALTWWTAFAPPIGYRFNSNPFTRLNGSNITPNQLADTYKAALASNAFIPGCTQFIVEFAGDFVAPRGIDLTAGGAVQWYGLARTSAGVIVPPAATYLRATAPDVVVAVWGPNDLTPTPAPPAITNQPQLIRITLQVRDPSGRLPDGIWREYVFRVKP